ncbi:MAG TPA: hypothetical protein VMG11_03060 [Steroidobacteraceae bacterium]|nr:hypothetical protein [Steroidobacteraceae bacterium]
MPLLTALWLAVPAIAAAAGVCDRTCLEALARSYWTALLAHDPGRLPHAATLTFTENNVRLRLGVGLWQTVSTADSPDIAILDEERGEVATMARITEGARAALAFARLKVARGQVTELETIVARRETASFLRPEGWDQARDLILQDLEPAARRSRTALIEVAEAYFERLPDSTKPLPPLDGRCNRIENGLRTTNNPDPFPGVTSPPLNAAVSRLSCEQQFASQTLSFVSRVRARRYPLVDETRGLVLALSLFDHDGVLAVTPHTGVKLSAPLPSPYSYIVAELFKISAGRIVLIEAVISLVPYGMASAWP